MRWGEDGAPLGREHGGNPKSLRVARATLDLAFSNPSLSFPNLNLAFSNPKLAVSNSSRGCWPACRGEAEGTACERGEIKRSIGIAWSKSRRFDIIPRDGISLLP
jgi:hypothetical protein